MSEPYIASLTISVPGAEGLESLSRVVEFVKEWASTLPQMAPLGVEQDQWDGGDFKAEADGCKLTIRSDVLDDAGYFTLRLESPDPRAPQYRISLNVDLAATIENPVEVGIESRFDPGSVDAPPPPNLLSGPPSLMTALLTNFDCLVGEESLATAPTRVSMSGAEEFVSGCLLEPERRLPLVALSRDWRNETSIDSGRMQRLLTGIASVVVLDSDVGDAVVAHLGRRQLACYNGAVRIYWPGFALNDGPAQHPFWTSQQAYKLGNPLYIQIQNACLQYSAGSFNRRSSAEIIRRIQDSKHERLLEQFHSQRQESEVFHRQVLDKEEELARLRAQAEEDQTHRERLGFAEAELEELRKRDADREVFRQLLKIAEEENDGLRGEIKDLQKKVEKLQQQLDNKDAEEIQHLETLPDTAMLEDSLAPDEFLFSINNVKDAVDVAEDLLDNLHFLQSAHKSADGHPYYKPYDVYKGFVALNQLAPILKRGEIGKSIEDALAPMGITYSHRESEATMNRYGDERRFKYGTGFVEMQAHLKFGAAHNDRYTLRVHLKWSEEDGEWLIGHVGEHLRTVNG